MTTTPTRGAADLRTAAQAVVDRWDTPLWKDVPATAEYIGRLRAALAAGQATAAPAQPAAQHYGPLRDADAEHGKQLSVYSTPRAQPAAQQGAQYLAQALTDRENQPNQYGVEFGMSGTHMHFKIGNQLFKLAYEPDEQEEFDFMKRMLVNAFSIFTHDVKTAPQPAPTAKAAESVPAPAPPPECETEAEKRAFAFGWFKALESERMKAESAQEDAARPDTDAAFEAARRCLCKIPRYSFALDSRGNVRRCEDKSGNWIEFDAAHALFDPVAVDAARKQGGA